ncbi:deoxyribodipyrimidine photo-lyase [Thaumasiovibrio sp. DFM-14]|uniref:deoxyribodipyrimidine photo-lyase n=1 Tax=Thaumasiovibrio sp. DFM-14 TaxID=3384792 RepID=UPI00399FB7B4
MSRAVIWLRRDLRLVDNTALHNAAQHHSDLILVYIATPTQWQAHHLAPIQADLIARRLAYLRRQAQQCHVPLYYLSCDSYAQVPTLLKSVCQQHGATHLYCNREYELNEVRRDVLVERTLTEEAIKFRSFDDSCILPPGSVLNGSGTCYRVFTPYRRAWVQQLLSNAQNVALVPSPLARQTPPLNAENYGVELPEIEFKYPKVSSSNYPVADNAIYALLSEFCQHKAAQYAQDRDYPARDGTSQLSPYLAIGALSARQCLNALMREYPNSLESQDSGQFVWLNELIWREFYKHLSAAYPSLSQGQPFVAWTAGVDWHESPSLLQAWQQGKTGFPIVDAAMRQLNTTGWMHNRLRMIVASFLTKDLQLDWREGERYFMSQLVDGDYASNNGGWQWAASTGTDAQPYFRVFNPTTQGKNYDPKGIFIRKWIPELTCCPDKYLHQPERWEGCIEAGYMLPIVDHAKARLMSIDRFKQAKARWEESQNENNAI